MMKTHPKNGDAAALSSWRTSTPISFDRFVESVIGHLVGTTSQRVPQDILPLVTEAMEAAYVASARRSEALFALPIAKLSAAEVVARGWISVTIAELNSAVTAARYYQIPSRGETIEGLFPVWQFVGPTPRLIEKVLPYLAGQLPQEIHAFWVSAYDELNELTPSEVLAGMPYETRGAIEECQLKYLMQSHDERVQRVLDLVKLYAIPT